eukprot:SAG11_NODE_178_length_13331_cov_17.694906_9_plen_99_part_00
MVLLSDRCVRRLVAVVAESPSSSFVVVLVSMVVAPRASLHSVEKPVVARQRREGRRDAAAGAVPAAGAMSAVGEPDRQRGRRRELEAARPGGMKKGET